MPELVTSTLWLTKLVLKPGMGETAMQQESYFHPSLLLINNFITYSGPDKLCTCCFDAFKNLKYALNLNLMRKNMHSNFAAQLVCLPSCLP